MNRLFFTFLFSALCALFVPACFSKQDTANTDSDSDADSDPPEESSWDENSVCPNFDNDRCENYGPPNFILSLEASALSEGSSFLRAKGQLLLVSESKEDSVPQPVVYALEGVGYIEPEITRFDFPTPLSSHWTSLGLVESHRWKGSTYPSRGMVSLCVDDQESCALYSVPLDKESHVLELVPNSDHPWTTGQSALEATYNENAVCIVGLGINCFDGTKWQSILEDLSDARFNYFNETVGAGAAGRIVHLDDVGRWIELTLDTPKDFVASALSFLKMFALSKDGAYFRFAAESVSYTECPFLDGTIDIAQTGGFSAWAVFNENKLATLTDNNVCFSDLPNDVPIIDFTMLDEGTCRFGRMITPDKLYDAYIWCTE